MRVCEPFFSIDVPLAFKTGAIYTKPTLFIQKIIYEIKVQRYIHIKTYCNIYE